MNQNKKIKVAVIGFGYWGPNLVRNFQASNLYDLVWVSDVSLNNLAKVPDYSDAKTTIDYKEVLRDQEVELISIATPIETHYDLIKDSLLAGKNVLVEKPLVDLGEHAQELVALAEKVGKKLAVGHTFVYTQAIRKIRELIDSGEIGDVLHINSERMNLGLLQKNHSVFWDLAVHDVSIIDYLLDQKKPVSVVADQSFLTGGGQAEIGVCSLAFDGKLTAQVSVSWLSPIKSRRIIVVGSKKMILYDDMSAEEKVKVMDRRVEINNGKVDYHTGDIFVPKLSQREALSLEFEELYHFLRDNGNFLSTGRDGLRVVKILQAIDKAALDGIRVKI